MMINVVRFRDAILLGKSLEPVRSLSNGQRYDGAFIGLSLFNELFIKVSFQHADPAKDYAQLVPLARIDTCLFVETVVDNAEPSPKKPRASKA